MLKSKIAKSGMINLPAEIKKNLSLKVGDEISFVKTDEGYLIIPIRDLFDLINPNEMDIAIKSVKELSEERKREGIKE